MLNFFMYISFLMVAMSKLYLLGGLLAFMKEVFFVFLGRRWERRVNMEGKVGYLKGKRKKTSY